MKTRKLGERSRSTTRIMIHSLVAALVVAVGCFHGCVITAVWKTKCVDLGDYVLLKGPIKLQEVYDNASGVTFNPDTNTLFIIINRPCCILEADLEGKMKRLIPLEFFDDTEGITYMGDGLYAVTEERKRNVCLIRIESNTNEVNYEDARVIVVEQGVGNNGLEGIAFDARKNTIYVVKEYGPRRIYRFSQPDKEKAPKVKQPWDFEKKTLGMDDAAGIHFHAATDHLLILSEASACIVECTKKGKEISRLDMNSGSAGLEHRIPQAEGLTMDDKGYLYVVSEPNLLYIFEKTAEVSR
jgi:uncharacterized protein YjiK